MLGKIPQKQRDRIAGGDLSATSETLENGNRTRQNRLKAIGGYDMLLACCGAIFLSETLRNKPDLEVLGNGCGDQAAGDHTWPMAVFAMWLYMMHWRV
jgi:hypothetical protein